MTAPLDRSKFREFPPSSFAVDHPTMILVLTVIILVMGLGAYLRIPKESSPEVVVPNIIVNTFYPGVAPKDMETLVTRPLEEELNTIGNVKEITSVSTEGVSSINVEFNAGVDMEDALARVREKVDIAKPEIPAAAEEPQIFEINFAQFPIMQVNVSGPYSLVRLREVAEDLQDELEQIPSVLEVQLSGGLEREVRVEVDLAKLKFYDLAFDDVVEAIQQENVTTPGGGIDVGELKYLVRVPGEFDQAEPIADIVITTRGGRAVYVRDVATVDFGFKDRDSFARLDADAVVSLAVKKRTGENIIETAAQVRATIARIEPRFPPGTVVKITSDQSEDIASMVASLENNIISGLILVVAVLLFFLGLRTAWFVGLAIPLSMLVSFLVMQAAGFSMNMVVLFSLILALGMLVDNAIVITENIYRFREQGWDRRSAAKFAVGEVAVPIIASTATTLAAFLPMAFWPGIVGEFMKYLPLTLIITLSASLFVALVIIPSLCGQFLELETAPSRPLTKPARGLLIGVATLAAVLLLAANWLSALLLALTALAVYGFHEFVATPLSRWFMGHALPAVIDAYERRLRWALDHRGLVLAGAFGFLVLTVTAFAMFSLGVEFFPEDIPPKTVYVQIEGPVGTRVEQTDRVAQRIEEELAGIPGQEDVESVVATVGSRVANDFGPTNGTHLGTIAVNFVDYQRRATDAFVTMERMRQTVGTEIAGADVSVEKPQDGPPTGAPITLEIIGNDADTLRVLANRVVALLESSPVFGRLDGLESDLAAGRPELIVDVDRERAALYGLNTAQVGRVVRAAINGVEASKFRYGKDEYDITVRLAPAYRENLSALDDLTLVPEDGGQVPLSSVARLRVGTGFSDVRRKDLDRVATVSSDVRAGHNQNAVLAEVQDVVAGFEDQLPPGYTLRWGGAQAEQQEAEEFLGGAFIVALLLIGFILVWQFDSITKPLIILTSVLLSTVGVLVGLLVFRMPFGIIMSGVGVISLAGIAVNNAIVLIDYTDLLRVRDGLTRREAVVLAGRTRFRPVILTAMTTVLGLVPLGIGMNLDFIGLYSALRPDFYWGGEQAAWWGQMAVAVIVGLSFATVLTLLVVPVTYSLLDDFERAVARLLTGRRTGRTGEFAVVTDAPALASPVPELQAVGDGAGSAALHTPPPSTWSSG
ncbi:MAG TPA: efflux RND transporter permease subunit [Gemmatimonadales bacterium]